jgi:hypothetical protein
MYKVYKNGEYIKLQIDAKTPEDALGILNFQLNLKNIKQGKVLSGEVILECIDATPGQPSNCSKINLWEVRQG